MQTFYYVDAHCGAGKTMQLVDVIKTRHLSHTHRIIIASTTKTLVNQTAFNLRSNGIACSVFHGGNISCGVMARYEKALLDETKRIILVTHQAFFKGLEFAKNGDFKVFIDEIPQIDTEQRYKLKHHKQNVLNAFAIKQFATDADFCEVTVKNTKLVNRYIQSDKDQVDAVLCELANKVSSPNYHVACKADTFKNFVDIVKPSEKFTTSAIMRPSVFSRWPDVTIMGANFTSSTMYRCWTLDDANFIPHPLFTGLSAVHPKEVGDRIKIGYVFELPFSKNQINTFTKNGFDVVAEMGRLAEQEFQGQPYLATFNNRTSEASMLTYETAEVIEPVSNGRNDLVHLHRAIYAMAANDAPTHINMMKNLFGFEGDELYLAHGFESAYQFLCRTSVRVAGSTEPLHFIVPDKRTATMLAHIFSCQSVYQIEHDMVLPDSEKKERKSKEEINRAAYQKTKNVQSMILTTGGQTAKTFKAWVENGCVKTSEGQNHFTLEFETGLKFADVKRRINRNCLLRVQGGKGLIVVPTDTIIPADYAQWLAEAFAKANTSVDIQFSAVPVKEFGEFKQTNKNTDDLTKYVQRDFKKFLGKA